MRAARMWFKQLRLHQWVKNSLLFVPLLAAQEVNKLEAVVRTSLGFISFSLVASAVYITNDLLDFEADSYHPRKKNRPLAAGLIEKKTALIVSVFLYLVGIFISLLISKQFSVFIIFYIGLSLIYSHQLKRIQIFDVLVLSTFYEIRIIAGGAITNTPISFWLIAFSIFFFLSIGIAKRCSEISTSKHKEHLEQNKRSYGNQDMFILLNIGISSAFASLLLLTLYVHDPRTASLYANPQLLLLVVPVLIFWICNLWVEVGRETNIEDPILFAIRDRKSLLATAAILMVIIMANM